MGNPIVHALVFVAAVLIPGGLLVYFAWRAISFKGDPNHTAQNPGSENIPGRPPTPAEAQSAFREMFPKDSLRAQSRRKQLDRVKAFRHRNSKT
jgi:hypothetical protein